MNDLAALEAALDDWPTDWPSRLVYADLLEDAGRADEAAYQRWAAANHVAPYGLAYWTWTDSANYPFHPAILGRAICAALRLAQSSGYREWEYRTRDEAEADLRRVAEEFGYATVSDLNRLCRKRYHLTPQQF